MLNRVGRRALDAYGRRGVLLGLLGVLWIALGFGFATSPQQRFAAATDTAALAALDRLTTPWLALMWIAGGLAAVVCAAIRHILPRDDYGFVGLIVPAMIWGVFYVWSWAASLTTLYVEIGRPNSWLAALVYWTVVALLLFIARWPDPDDPLIPRRSGGAP